MPTFMIVRDIPGASAMTEEQASQTVAMSEGTLTAMRGEGKDIAQERSFVVGDNIFCVYNASSAELIHEHSKRTGIPLTSVREVAGEIQHDTSGY
ncbi:MAG: hypothetical protein CK531_04650 [Gemmatimonadetes bacterium]|nr:MAG: hypothetical protein CK531_04650 [Gemmatimonadota bacterium]